ncbi:MAG: hypothetical protein AAF830_11750 [Pseudomonadota bacterium]
MEWYLVCVPSYFILSVLSWIASPIFNLNLTWFLLEVIVERSVIEIPIWLILIGLIFRRLIF